MRKSTRFARGATMRAVACAAAMALGVGLIAGCAGHARTTAPATPASRPSADSGIQAGPADAPADLAGNAVPAPVALRPDAPLHYVVKKGDTLWGIAGYYLKAPWQWPQLWYENPRIRNPHRIYPGDVLKLERINGRPRLTDESAIERLEPRVRSLPLAQATPAIPYAAIRDFLDGPRLVDADRIDDAPYVVAFTGAHLVGSAGDGIFVKNLPRTGAASWSLVHIGKAYRDPDTGELLGYEAIPVGRAELRKAGAPARLEIVKNDRETQVGDRLLPLAARDYRPQFVPHPPPHAVDGSIISVFGGVIEVGQHSIVTLDRGSADGLDPGTVLRIMQAARTVPDPYGGAGSTVRLPPQPAGLLMVFQATPHLSYALVMDETRAVRVLDRIAAPEAPRD